MLQHLAVRLRLSPRGDVCRIMRKLPRFCKEESEFKFLPESVSCRQHRTMFGAHAHYGTQFLQVGCQTNTNFLQKQKFWRPQTSQRSLSLKVKILGPLSFQISLSISESWNEVGSADQRILLNSRILRGPTSKRSNFASFSSWIDSLKLVAGFFIFFQNLIFCGLF